MGRHGTIAGRKAAQDSKRAAMFTKYAKAITVAAKDGGDPEYNAGLRVAIEKAKAISMPNDNIQRAIKKGTGELEGVSYEELSFEGYGAGGVAVIVDCLTDNTNRTTSFVRSTFDKHGGNLGTNGCVSYMFSRKGVILIYDIGIFRTDCIIELIAANKIFLVNGSLNNFGNSVQFFIGQMDDTFVKVFAAAVVDKFNIAGKNKLYLTLREMRQSSKNLIISRRSAIVLQARTNFR